MSKKFIWLVASCLMVLALLAAACAPKEEAPAVTTPKETTPTPKQEVSPEEKETVPAGADTVTVTLTKIDGTRMQKTIEKPRYGGTFIYSMSSGPHGWDEGKPGVPPYSAQIYWMGHTNEELLQGRWEAGPAGTGEIGWTSTGYWANPDVYRGALAESWEFPDDTTIIFHIRKGVYWHNKPPVNGREFTAEDAAWSIKRIFIDNKTTTMYSMAGVSRPTDAYAQDKYTLVVKNPPGQQGYTWEYVGDWMSMYAPEVIEKYGTGFDWENVVGTGPFILTDYVPMSAGTWERNPNYWETDPMIPENRLPYINRMRLLIIPDVSTQMAAIRTGKIDRHGLTEENAQQVISTSSKELKYISYLYPVYCFLGFRQDKDLAFNDVRVRRALNMAIDWKTIVDTVNLGNGEYLVAKVMPLKDNPDLWEAYIPHGQLWPAADGFDTNRLFSYEPEAAKQLLAEAGYPNGFKTSAIVGSTSVTNIDQMLVWKEYWKKHLNVEFNLDIKEPAVYQSMHASHTYPEGNMCGRWGDQPYAMCSVRTGLQYNTAIIEDPKMDDYYNRMTAVYFDVPKRTEILKEMNQYYVSQAYYYSPTTGFLYTFWWPWVKGYHGESAIGVDNGIYQKYIWIDTELKKSMGY